MLNLDPHPANELGRGILCPADEAALIARGVVFSVSFTLPSGRIVRNNTMRPVDEVVAGLRDPAPLVAMRNGSVAHG